MDIVLPESAKRQHCRRRWTGACRDAADLAPTPQDPTSSVVFLSLLAFLVVVGIASRHLVARERTERKLRDVQNKLYQATSAMSEALVIYDDEDRLVLCNDNYRKLYGAAADSIVPGVRLDDVLDAGRQFGVAIDEVDTSSDLAAQPDRQADGAGRHL